MGHYLWDIMIEIITDIRIMHITNLSKDMNL